MRHTHQPWRRICAAILAVVLFLQFTSISALAQARARERNTLEAMADKFRVASPPSPVNEQGIEKLRDYTRHYDREAVRELNHTLKKIHLILADLLAEAENGRPLAPGIKELQAKFATLLLLDDRVLSNLQIREEQPENAKSASNLKKKYLQHMVPIRTQLEAILKKQTNVYQSGRLDDIRTLSGFVKAAHRLEDHLKTDVLPLLETPLHPPATPSFRTADFPPIPPRTDGKVVPAYKRSSLTESKEAANSDKADLFFSTSATEDLQETVDVVITQEMRDLTASLNNSPARIFAWVRTHVETEFYYGSMKGSRGTFAELAGNDIDTVSLLLALFRAADIPCRYVTGTIELSLVEAQNLTGIDDANQIGTLLASAGYPATIITSGGQPVAIQIEHMWAEAFVDYDPFAGAVAGSGDLWVPLSPWYKAYDTREGSDLLTSMGFNSETFLQGVIAQVQALSPAEQFKLDLDNYLAQNQPGGNWQDVLRKRTLKAELFRTLPTTVNFKVVSVNGEYAELPDSLRHKVTISVPEVSLSHTLNLSDIIMRKVTFSYPPADEASRTLIDASDGIENVAPLSVNLLPSLKIEGTTVATGNVVNAGYYHTLRTTFVVPRHGTDVVDYSVISGAYYAVGIDPQTVSTKYLARRTADYLSLTDDVEETSATMDGITGEALYLAGMRYFNDVNAGDRLFAAALNDVFLKQTSGAITGKNLVVYTLFGTPSDLGPGGYFVDAKRNIYTPVSVSGDHSRELDFMILGGYNSSFFEHHLFEEFFNLNAISTVKLLALASEQGMPIYDIDSSNIGSTISLLSLDSSTKSAIQNAVANGHVVKVHRDPLTVGEWSGAGYIDRDPTDNSAGYIISGGWAGGSTTGNDTGNNGGPGSGPTAGDPVNVVNGNFFHSSNDFSIPAVGSPLALSRHYNSMVTNDGPFGRGWSFSYGERVNEDEADGSVTYLASDGGIFLYKKNPDGTYQRPTGKFTILSKDASDFILREKNGLQRVFDLTGRLVALTDPNGNSQTLTYSGDLLVTVTDPAGRSIHFTYDGDDRITSITGPGGHSWQYGYDGGKLASFTNNASQTTTYIYNTDGWLASITNPTGGTVAIDYYSNGKTSLNLLPNGGTYTYAYNDPMKVTTVTDPEGNSTIYYYTTMAVISGRLDSLGNEEFYEFDADFNSVLVTDKNGGITKNSYDGMDNLLSSTDQLNHTTVYTYDPLFNKVLTATDPEGNVTTFTYDAAGNLLSSLDAEGVLVEYTYLTNGLMQSLSKGGVLRAVFSYHPDGNIATVTDSLTNVTTLTYDVLGRLTNRTAPDGSTTTYTLDAAGNVLATIDALGNESHFTYNALNRRTSFTDGNGKVTTYDYDSMGNLLQVTDPLGYVKSFTYNPFYKPLTKTDKNGNTTNYSYDAMGRLEQKSNADGSTESFRYNPVGNIVLISGGEGDILLEYDAASRLTTRTDVFGQKCSYTYTPAGRRATMTDPLGGVTTYQYYANGKLKAVTDQDLHTTTYQYDGDLVGTIIYPNGIETELVYDGADHIVDLVNRSQDGTEISRYGYTYNSVGYRQTMSAPDGEHSYQYDPGGRLVRVDYPDGKHSVYGYDGAGNRVSLTNDEQTVTYSYDADNRLLAAGEVTYSYDNNGNTLSRDEAGQTATYSYNLKNELVQITSPNGSVTENRYNAIGQRIARLADGGEKRYLYDGADLLMETIPQGLVTASYVNGLPQAGPLALKTAADEYCYFLKDGLSNVVQLTDGDGLVTARYGYDIFGALRSASVINDYGVSQSFTGKELEPESGLIYFGARFYDPEVGRFLSADSFTWGPDDVRQSPYGQTGEILSDYGAHQPDYLNSYVYCLNNPVNLVDLNGNQPTSIWQTLGTILGWISIVLAVIGIIVFLWAFIPALLGGAALAAAATTAGGFLAGWQLGLGIASLVTAIGSLIFNPPSNWTGWVTNSISLILGVIVLVAALSLLSFSPLVALALSVVGLAFAIWGMFARREQEELQRCDDDPPLAVFPALCREKVRMLGEFAQTLPMNQAGYANG
ncbi:MAG: hypothetical protein KKC76_13030 [Proteobacteria bacterium]|nr:hypothetical protein [Pseudomonadota bacterium]MBU4294962.1 hypothetical protein [Pseudomonadota bacterium]MCG2746686.1 DUF6531 domain-containing protein [Desulfobulbaceae bacterium]